MTVVSGSEEKVAIGNGDSPEQYIEIEAAEIISLSMRNTFLTKDTVRSHAWPDVMQHGADTQQLRVTLRGVITGGAGEALLEQVALNGSLRSFHITLRNGNQVGGTFYIASYQLTGNQQQPQEFTATCFSSGIVN
jgi:predicted secreted protein